MGAGDAGPHYMICGSTRTAMERARTPKGTAMAACRKFEMRSLIEVVIEMAPFVIVSAVIGVMRR